MYSLKRSDDGKRVKVHLNTGSGTQAFDALIKFRNGYFYLYSNYQYLHNENTDSKPLGFKYTFNCGSAGEVLFDFPHFISLEFTDAISVLCKKDGAGPLFRRIYNIDKNLIYLGSIQKTPEDCKKASAVITVMDYEYLQSKGWAKHEQEITAEQRAALARKNPK